MKKTIILIFLFCTILVIGASQSSAQTETTVYLPLIVRNHEQCNPVWPTPAPWGRGPYGNEKGYCKP